MSIRVHYVINARVPHIRAYGIQIAKMSEALVGAGVELTLVVPATRAAEQDMRAVNGLRTSVRTVVLFGLDWYDKGRIPFLIASLVFMVSSFVYLVSEKFRGRIDYIYTVDMDTFSYFLLPFTGLPVFAEMHGAKRRTLANRLFFSRARGIIATNVEIAHALSTTFALPDGRCTVEPNGVDVSAIANAPEKHKARAILGLADDSEIALYAGRFYTWKGLDILVRAAHVSPGVSWYVIGGTEQQFKAITGTDSLPGNLHIMGDKKSEDIPVWLSAADALLILGTKAHEQSYRFTAPMKVYEYMAANRIVVAAQTPALTSIIPETDALFYEPDNAEDLARVVGSAYGADVSPVLERAFRSAEAHSWTKRANRVITFMTAV